MRHWFVALFALLFGSLSSAGESSQASASPPRTEATCGLVADLDGSSRILCAALPSSPGTICGLYVDDRGL